MGPLIFLIYINDLNHALKFCKPHHFADDTSLLHISKSLKTVSKQVNIELKNLTKWLNANKLCLNVSKTELIIFKPSKKVIDFDLKFQLNGKQLYPTNSAKYLGVKIDNKLNWNEHINDVAIKLNRANVMLYKTRDYVNEKTLRSIYYAIFDSYINYASNVWGQNSNTTNRLHILQKKALRTIYFEKHQAHSTPLFYRSSILKLTDKITVENCMFISKCVNNHMPSVFNNWFEFASTSHRYETFCSANDLLKILSCSTKRYGKEAIINSAISSWNKI